MSRSFLTPINLNQFELQNAVHQALAASPASAKPGQAYYSTSLNALLVYNGTAWVPADASKVGAGFIPFASVAGIQGAINATPLSGIAPPTANVAMAGFTLTGLATPAAAGQAAEYSWVVAQVQAAAAGIASKAPVNLVATGNQALTGTGQTIDGTAVAAGMRILLTGQTTASQNGVYVAGSGTWTQPADDGATLEIEPGATWLATQGSSYAGSMWRVATTGTITLGTTALSIVMFALPTTYAAGNGLQLSSGVFSAQVAAAGGVLAGASGLAVDGGVVTRKYAVTIGDGSSTSYTVTHNLGTLDVTVQGYLVSSGAQAEFDVARSSASAITIGFGTAPAAASIRVLVQG